MAKTLAIEYSTNENPCFVAGAIDPSGKLPSADDPEVSNIGFDELRDVFQEQAIDLIQGGVNLLLVETSQDILELRANLAGIRSGFEVTGIYLPIQAQVTLDTTGRVLWDNTQAYENTCRSNR